MTSVQLYSRERVIRSKGAIPYFVTVWKTDNAGTSAANQITIPLNATTTYDATVAWGDGTTSTLAGTGTNIGAGATHTYAAAGTYTVRISGDFPRIAFDNGGDKLKILDLRNWGDIVWGVFLNQAFRGCSNLEITARDVPKFTPGDAIITNQAFQLIKSINSKVEQYFKGVTISSMIQPFRQITTGLNYNLNGFNTTGCADFSLALAALGVNPNLRCDGWNFASATNVSLFLQGTTLSTQNYDHLLISLASQAVNPDLDFHGGDSKYSGDPAGDPATSGAAARAKLLRTVADGGRGWTSITDGGHDTAVYSATITDLRISAVDETAFLDNCAAITEWADGEHAVVITDANGKELIAVLDTVGSGETYQELLENGDLELGNTNGWLVNNWSDSSTELSANSATPISGDFDLKVVSISTDASNPRLRQLVSVTKGELLHFQAKLKTESESGITIAPVVLRGEANGTGGSSQTIHGGNSNIGTTVVSQSNIQTASFDALSSLYNGLATGTWYFDDVSLRKITAPSANGIILTNAAQDAQSFHAVDSAFVFNAASYAVRVVPI